MVFPMAQRTAARGPGRVINGLVLPPVANDPASRLGRMQAASAAQAPAAEAPPGPQVRYSAPEGEQPLYQADGRDRLAGYLSNPTTHLGRQRMLEQAMEAPAGGWVRRGLEGQEVFGHTITNAQARMAEQAAAGVLATGVGGWGLLEAIDALNGDPQQTPGTMVMV